MISQTAEYALRAIVALAQHDHTPLTTRRIADLTKLRPAYLSKVMHTLGRKGLVIAQRGVHGGFTLTRGADEMSVLEIINAVDPIKRTPRGEGTQGSTHQLPLLHRHLDAATAQVERVFRRTTIEQLIEDEEAHAAPSQDHRAD